MSRRRNTVWFADFRGRLRFESQAPSECQNFTVRKRGKGLKASIIYTFEVDLPEYESRRVVVRFSNGFSPGFPHVTVDGPSQSPHPTGAGSSASGSQPTHRRVDGSPRTAYSSSSATSSSTSSRRPGGAKAASGSVTRSATTRRSEKQHDRHRRRDRCRHRVQRLDPNRHGHAHSGADRRADRGCWHLDQRAPRRPRSTP